MAQNSGMIRRYHKSLGCEKRSGFGPDILAQSSEQA